MEEPLIATETDLIVCVGFGVLLGAAAAFGVFILWFTRNWMSKP